MNTILPLKEYYYSKQLKPMILRHILYTERVTMLEIFDKEVLLFLLQQFLFCFNLIIYLYHPILLANQRSDVMNMFNKIANC